MPETISRIESEGSRPNMVGLLRPALVHVMYLEARSKSGKFFNYWNIARCDSEEFFYTGMSSFNEDFSALPPLPIGAWHPINKDAGLGSTIRLNFPIIKNDSSQAISARNAEILIEQWSQGLFSFLVRAHVFSG